MSSLRLPERSVEVGPEATDHRQRHEAEADEQGGVRNVQGDFGSRADVAVADVKHHDGVGLHRREHGANQEDGDDEPVDDLLPRRLEPGVEQVHRQMPAAEGDRYRRKEHRPNHHEDQHFLGPEDRSREHIAADDIGDVDQCRSEEDHARDQVRCSHEAEFKNRIGLR